MGQKTHICHLVYSFNIGGLERVIVNCINNLDESLFEHTIIALTDVGEFINEIESPVSHYSLGKKAGKDLSVYPKLLRLLKDINPDVLHTYNLATIEYQWVGFLARVPLRIHAEHGRDSYDPNGDVKKYQIIRKVCNPIIHRFIAVSGELRHWLVSVVGIPQTKVLLLPNGIDITAFHPDYTPRVSFKSFKNKFVFGHVARMHSIKNQKFMLRAFCIACKESLAFADNCVLVLVGDGPEITELRSYVDSEESLRSRVFFEGSRSNVRDYYSLFDVFLMSSIAEGVPMTLLESMAMSTTHLVTRVGGITEVAENDVTGILVDSGDFKSYSHALVDLFEQDNKREEMATNSRNQVVNNYNQKEIMSHYTKLYVGEV